MELRIMMRLVIIASAALALACGARAQVAVSPVIATSQIPTSNVDSTAVWVSPAGDSALLFVTQKDGDRVEVRSATTGELLPATPFLGGKIDSAEPGQFNRPNGVWVIYHVPAGGGFVDVLLVTDQRNLRVQVFRLPDLAYFGEFGNPELGKCYGIAWYQDGTDFHVFITDNQSGTGKLKKYRLLDLRNKLGGELELVFGQSTGAGSLPSVESVLADPLRGWLHVCGDEGGKWNRIYRFDGTYAGITYGDPQFEHDQEGINLYDTGAGRGYLIVSDQYTGEPNQFEVFDRATLAPLGRFQSPAAGALVTRNTDGAFLEQRPLPGFPNGAFYPVNDDRNVHIYDWTDIAESMKLEIRALDRPFAAVPGADAGPARNALWYHDGSLWGVFPHEDCLAMARLEDGTFNFRDRLSSAPRAIPSVVADGNELAILLTGDSTEIHLFSYQQSTRSYLNAREFFPLPQGVSPGAALEIDGAGRGWIGFQKGGEARVVWSSPRDLTLWAGEGLALGAASAPPRLTRFGGGLGLLWSTPTGVVFRFRLDSDPPEVWGGAEQVSTKEAVALSAADGGGGMLLAAGAGASGAGWAWLRVPGSVWRESSLGFERNLDPTLVVDSASGRAHLLSRSREEGRSRLFRREAELETLLGGGSFGSPAPLLAWPGVNLGPPLVAGRPAGAASGLVAAALGDDGLGYFVRIAEPSGPDLSPPITLQHFPPPGAVGVEASARVSFRMTDDLEGVDRSSLRVFLNGEPVTPSIRGVPRNLLVSAALPAGLRPAVAGREITVRIEAADRAALPNRMPAFEYRFRLAGPRVGMFLRGDCQGDGVVDVSDAVAILLGLYAGRPIPCPDGADTDDDGELTVTDPIVLLDFLFREAVLPPPALTCGPDATADALGCEVSDCG